MLHAGLDLSRKRLDVHVLDDGGRTMLATAVTPDRDGLSGLARQLDAVGEPAGAAIESMTGARFVHDQLELLGWDVDLADTQKVRGVAPLARKTDKIDAQVLATLSYRDLVPAIWLPSPSVRAERERARWRLHLVHHRVSLKNRIHATLMTFGHQRSMTDLFGVGGRQFLERLKLPEPWSGDVAASIALIDHIEGQIEACEAELKRLGSKHPYVPLLVTVPGIGWVLASTIASEIGDISRLPHTEEALRVYRTVSSRVSVWEQGPARRFGQERT